MLETDAEAKYENIFNYYRAAAWNHNMYAKYFKCSFSITMKKKNY